MALTKCKECGKRISKKAEKCPNCGAPVKNKTKFGCGSIIYIFFAIVVILVVISVLFSPDNSSDSKSKQSISDSDCKKTLQCWGDKHNIAAAFSCDDYVEKLAKYSSKWTDGLLDPKFGHFRWKDKTKGIVTFIGDKIQFQNGFGAWQNYIYECDYDPVTEKVLSVRGRPGKL